MKKHRHSLNQLLSGITQTNQNITITGLTHDSRQVQPGFLFLAYPGLQADGRDYIEQAIRQGAAAICFEPTTNTRSSLPKKTIPLIPIPELNRQQARIAANFYQHPSQNLQMVGVTGTNGKTSCVHFIAQALTILKQKTGLIGTLGYGTLLDLHRPTHTTPDAIQLQRILAELRDQHIQTVAMEVSSHALAQHRVDHIKFDIALYTQLSQDHLDYHGDMQQYAAAKELLFQQPYLKKAIINADDDFGQTLIKRYAKKLHLMTYSANGQQHATLPSVIAKKCQLKANGMQLTIDTPWGEGSFTSSLLGQFNVSNLLGVIAVLGQLGIKLDQILRVLPQLKTVDGRMQHFGGDQLPTIIVDYAHTPDALSKALHALRPHCQGKLICVFGCGGDRDRSKRAKMAAIAEQFSDHVIVTNDNPRNEDPNNIINDIQQGFQQLSNIQIESDRAQAIAYAVQSADVDDMVLIAGKGHERYQIIKDKILPFDDGQHVQKQLDCRQLK